MEKAINFSSIYFLLSGLCSSLINKKRVVASENLSFIFTEYLFSIFYLLKLFAYLSEKKSNLRVYPLVSSTTRKDLLLTYSF